MQINLRNDQNENHFGRTHGVLKPRRWNTDDKIEAQSQIELWETVRTLLAVKTYTNVYTR